MAALPPLWVEVWDQALLLYTSLSDAGDGSCPLAWDRGVIAPVPAVGWPWHLLGVACPLGPVAEGDATAGGCGGASSTGSVWAREGALGFQVFKFLSFLFSFVLLTEHTSDSPTPHFPAPSVSVLLPFLWAPLFLLAHGNLCIRPPSFYLCQQLQGKPSQKVSVSDHQAQSQPSDTTHPDSAPRPLGKSR